MPTSHSSRVRLTTLAYGGDALGRLPDGRAVFIPFGLPGELVEIAITEEKPHYARGRIVEVHEPSPKRIKARCAHFSICGGCHYQHMPYADQLSVKEEILQDQLNRIAGISGAPIKKAVPSRSEWHYRNHIQFQLDRDSHLGYLAAQSNTVIPITECFLPEERLSSTWPLLQFEPGVGIDRIALRQGMDDDVMLVLESRSLDTPEMEVEGLPVSVVHVSPAGPVVMAGSSYIVSEVLGNRFRVSAGSFFQVNTQVAEAMVQHILDVSRLSPGMQALDLYCGVGLFSAFLAPHVGRLVGVESSPDACADFVFNLDEYDHIELYEAEVEAVIPAIQIQPSLVVADPPRNGMSRQALEGIVRLGPEQVIYASCNPATLARDARVLIQAGYRLESVQPFDLFPQTYHIETISLFER